MSATLILLPGLHGTPCLFGPLLAVIPAEMPRRLVNFPTDRPCSVRQLLELLERELEGEAEMVLIAESFSGPIAMQFAAANPGRVRALILCATFVAEPVPVTLCYLATPLIWLHVPIPAIAIRMFLGGIRAPRALVRQVAAAVRLNSPRVLAHRVRLAGWVNSVKALQSCKVPILCLGARRDRLVGRRSVRRIRRLRPDIPIRMLDAPHLMLQLMPGAAWREISEFLAGIPETAPLASVTSPP